MIYLDSETMGLVGPIVLLQYAIDDGPIVLHNPWVRTVNETIQVLEDIANHPDGICGFNLTFDVFHICQMYTTLVELRKSNRGGFQLQHTVSQYAIRERDARDGDCWKPVKALDLMLHARKGKFQTLMNRDDIKIRKVPIALAYPLAEELNKRICLDPIYFSRRKTHKTQWEVYLSDEYDNDFANVVMKFGASTALKALCKYVLNMDDDEIIAYGDIEIDDYYMPKELTFAPYALASATIHNEPCNNYPTPYLLDHFDEIDWKLTWPDFLHNHVAHWEMSRDARQYAAGDIDKTRRLHYYFNEDRGSVVEAGDDDSELACMVGACRWKGFSFNVEGIKELKKQAQAKVGRIPTAPEAVTNWVKASLSETEYVCSEMGKSQSTKKMVLEKMTKLLSICEDCRGTGAIDDNWPANSDHPFNKCPNCQNGKVLHESAIRARHVLDAREALKEIQLYDKLLVANRLHPDFNVIGTLSSRMSGSGGINAQGINKAGKVREQFTLAIPPMLLDGGDFSSFEVVIAIAVWGDKKLEETVTSYRECHKCHDIGTTIICDQCEGKEKSDLFGNVELCEKCNNHRLLDHEITCFQCKGKGKVKTKIHALFGTYIYKGMSYEDIVDSDGSNVFDYYTRSKSGLFSQMYGGTDYTLADRLAIPEEEAREGMNRFLADYPDVARAMARVKKLFQSMVQKVPRGKIEWHEPADYIEEPIMGHRRYFTLENEICKALYDLANNPPKEWKDIKIKVWRRDREQLVTGAVQSALFGAAFMIQSANVRRAINHEIQSSGAKITKYVQRKVWDIQPSGIHPFVVMPMNIHDELMTCCLPEYSDRVSETVKQCVEFFKSKVPLLGIDWKKNIPNWGAKKG